MVASFLPPFAHAETTLGGGNNINIERVQFVIRLNLGDQRKPPRWTDAGGEPVKLFIQPGETVIHPKIYDLGEGERECHGLLAKGYIPTPVDHHLP